MVILSNVSSVSPEILINFIQERWGKTIRNISVSPVGAPDVYWTAEGFDNYLLRRFPVSAESYMSDMDAVLYEIGFINHFADSGMNIPEIIPTIHCLLRRRTRMVFGCYFVSAAVPAIQAVRMNTAMQRYIAQSLICSLPDIRPARHYKARL